MMLLTIAWVTFATDRRFPLLIQRIRSKIKGLSDYSLYLEELLIRSV